MMCYGENFDVKKQIWVIRLGSHTTDQIKKDSNWIGYYGGHSGMTQLYAFTEGSYYYYRYYYDDDSNDNDCHYDYFYPICY